MERNEANWDRTLRVIVGLSLLSLAVVGPRTAWGLVGLIPLFTGVFGYCPVYRLFGKTTCGAAPRRKLGEQ